MKLKILTISIVLTLPLLSQAEITEILDCKSTNSRAVYSSVKVLKDSELPFGKNLSLEVTSTMMGSILKKIDHAFESQPTGLRLKLLENDETIVYLFTSTVGGDAKGQGGTKLGAVSIEDKLKQPGSFGSQLEFLNCK